jgi:DNA-binding NtrC family response regulator
MHSKVEEMLGDAHDTLTIERRPSEGPWAIEVEHSGRKARAILHKGERCVIGTAEDTDIRLEDPSVSAKHCALDATHDGLQIVDLDSRNGVLVGNVKVSVARLDSECQAIVLGKTTIILRAGLSQVRNAAFEAVPGLIGSSEPIQRVVTAIRKYATLKAPILLVGESGVGKDVVARAIHTLSGRPGGYCPMNVATIPEGLADSEFFGHVKGAFTGASASRVGAFTHAHKGTLLLDEIGELPLSIQAKLLRVVEDGVIRPVGGLSTQVVDVRLISASWVPLMDRVLRGAFRFDLLQRLSTVVIEIPPLRKRKSDIPVLVGFWTRNHESEIGPRILTSAAIGRLLEHNWPGNIRELWAVLYRACTNASGVEVDWPEVDAGIRAGLDACVPGDSNPKKLLERYQGNVSMAARAAGVPRSTFRSRLVRDGGADRRR